MHPGLPLDALVAPLRADVVSGATVLGRAAADALRKAVERLEADDLDDLGERLAEVVLHVLDAQPAMAPLVSLCGDVLEAVAGADSVEAAREAAVRASRDFREGLDERTARAAARTAELLPEGAVVATVSYSSTVRDAILARRGPGQGSVFCLESRPQQEGRLLAAALADKGVPVTYAVDAAAASVVPGCDVVLLGADSVGDAGAVNKIGSMALADAARRSGVPVYVVTDRTKILPPGFPQHHEADRPSEEVWKPPAGVRVWNRYFEAVPLDLVTALITDSATLEPAQVEEMRRALELPAAIRSWAAKRAGASPPGG